MEEEKEEEGHRSGRRKRKGERKREGIREGEERVKAVSEVMIGMYKIDGKLRCV